MSEVIGTRRLVVQLLLVVVAMFWAVSIHTVTAFLFSANAGRPFWHTALLGPRFIASAFVSGPALLAPAFVTSASALLPQSIPRA